MYESVLVVVEPSHTSQNEMTLSQRIFPEILVIGSKEKMFRTICEKRSCTTASLGRISNDMTPTAT